MKFARYLEETQVPEWKRAYIDYDGLKNRITAIINNQGAPENERVAVESPIEARHSPTIRRDSDASMAIVEEPLTLPSILNAPRRRQSQPQVQIETEHEEVSSETLNADIARPPPTPVVRGRSRSANLRGRVHTRATAAQKTPVVPLFELMPTLTPLQTRFFEKLDTELEKVECFYLDREKEAKARFAALKQQLVELHDHKRLHDSLQEGSPQWLRFSLNPGSVNSTVRSRLKLNKLAGKPSASDDPRSFSTAPESMKAKFDPDEYQNAKKKIKKALLEFYRTLEVLNNYRTLNMIGFSKALKKFEKATLISAQESYIKERVDISAFSSAKPVSRMLTDTEDIFTSRFARGDRKRGRARLRAGWKQKSHHFASFRTGLAVGLGLPALVSGLYHGLNHEIRLDVPAWGGLLFIYGVMIIPVLFSFLVGVNLLVWTKARINYPFIFELDVKTKLDYQEYFEIPALLFCTLSWAFWLSFARIGTDKVDPTTWPLIWLAFCAFLTMNPLPIYYRASRSWLYRIFGRLLLPGVRRVEFADFWIGDQFCSLWFPLSNLYFFGCIYTERFPENWQECSSKPPHWGVPLTLAALPLLVRFIQSVRRWWDSGLVTHLMNAAKYAIGIINFAFYYNWRHNDGRHSGAAFALYCLAAAAYSIVACAWDFLVDWSLFKPHAKYPLLREELLGADYIPMYYFSIVSNLLLRFIWMIYIPKQGPNFLVRSFIVGFLEMIRRWIWNFCRVENEHVGNVDQYRATREVPLPYSFNDAGNDSDGGDEDDNRGIAFSFFGRTPHS